MTDKQRADHVQASYWNGYITRTEAQKVFDQTAGVIQAQQQALQAMDAVISYFAEKFNVTKEDVQAWAKLKFEEAQKSSLEKAVDASTNSNSDLLPVQGQQSNYQQAGEQAPSIVLTDLA